MPPLRVERSNREMPAGGRLDVLEYDVDIKEREHEQRARRERIERIEKEVEETNKVLAVNMVVANPSSKKSIKKRQIAELRQSSETQATELAREDLEAEQMSDVEKISVVYAAIFGSVAAGAALFLGRVGETGVKDRHVPPAIHMPLFISLLSIFALPFVPEPINPNDRLSFLALLAALQLGLLAPHIIQIIDPLVGLVRHEPTMLHPRAMHVYRFIGAFNLVYLVVVLGLCWTEDPDEWWLNVARAAVADLPQISTTLSLLLLHVISLIYFCSTFPSYSNRLLEFIARSVVLGPAVMAPVELARKRQWEGLGVLGKKYGKRRRD
ncbi:hypothetical protein HDU93_008350 [Gonapodya sp. JEL0774]|nr:hypothetical protein HDU93_008350 [Gonapodya sp. JEL0774]